MLPLLSPFAPRKCDVATLVDERGPSLVDSKPERGPRSATKFSHVAPKECKITRRVIEFRVSPKGDK